MELDKKFYAEKGYLIFKNFFTAEEMDTILLDVLKVFSIAFTDERKNDFLSLDNLEKTELHLFELFERDSELFIRLGKQCQHLISLWRLSTSKKIENLLLELGLEFPNLSVRPSMFFNSRLLDKVGHYWKLGDHQDWRSSQGSLDSVTLWYPYVDCNVELGALEIIEGSHLEGLYECSDVEYYSKINDELIDESKYESVEMEKGDLLLFNSFLVHRSGTNSTRRVRWSSQLRYNNLLEESFVRRRLPNPYVYKPFEELVEPGPPSKQEIIDYFKTVE
ncbi:phytanoyl-CoA dioxygenase family protein [Parvicella tangerina]|uniref:Phytanoyl-CoA dioxygenase n=1 Tax=Parvicella tangerina TaxID=2829795 RepID=A0A916JKQ4_9FLAO|nr:phytanoyl-CoA dioxygenase family protein [Parvicella tangerina]CAG5079710.1 hypothetical protein CRYO30217_01028 [Parvicella tangerina]